MSFLEMEKNLINVCGNLACAGKFESTTLESKQAYKVLAENLMYGKILEQEYLKVYKELPKKYLQEKQSWLYEMNKLSETMKSSVSQVQQEIKNKNKDKLN